MGSSPPIFCDSLEALMKEIGPECLTFVKDTVYCKVCEKPLSDNKPGIIRHMLSPMHECSMIKRMQTTDPFDSSMGMSEAGSGTIKQNQNDLHKSMESEPKIVDVGFSANGQLWMVIKRKGSNQTDFISAKKANEFWPHLVIAFHETRMPHPSRILKDFSGCLDFKEFGPERILDRVLLPPRTTLFIMKWKESDETSFVLPIEANLICPQVVIEYYQTCIRRSRFRLKP